MKNILKISSVATLIVMPLFVFAFHGEGQSNSSFLRGLQNLLRGVGSLVDYATILVAGIALLVFFWGLAKFILKIGGDDSLEEGKNLMKWGIIALFIMVSIWGIISFMQDQFNIRGTEQAPYIPTFRL